jgi:cell division protein FtsB
MVFSPVKKKVKESTKIITALFGAYMIIMGAQLLLGSQGILALEELKSFQVDLKENLKDLENTQSQLKVRFEQLKSNRRVLSLEARDLGLFRSGEKVMRLIGLRQDLPFSFEGTVLRHRKDHGIGEDMFRLAGLIIALVIYLIMTIANIVWFSTNKKGPNESSTLMNKTPVYQYF